MTKRTKSKPKQYTPVEKVAILRRHLVDQVPVSEVCREQQLHPNVFYRWQKIFFEGGAAAFAPSGSAQVNRLSQQVEALQAQLVRKNDVLAEVMEAYVQLTKNTGVFGAGAGLSWRFAHRWWHCSSMARSGWSCR